jgi:hypothetical protein
VDALPESIRVRRSFPSSSSVKCRSSTKILWIPTESRLLSPSGVSGFRVVGIPTALPRSGWFTNHSKSFTHFSYVICAFTYHIVELVFVLSYIWSRAWGSIEYSGTRCDDYYLIPRRFIQDSPKTHPRLRYLWSSARSKWLTFEGSRNSRHTRSHYTWLLLKHETIYMTRQTPILLYSI